MRPMEFEAPSRYHRLPSGPLVRSLASASFGKRNDVNAPAGVSLSISPLAPTHRLPSGPTAMEWAESGSVTRSNGKSLPLPVVVTLATATRSRLDSTIHRLPPGPATIPFGWPPEGG